MLDLDDDRPECTLRSNFGGTCYCTGRPGCVAGDDDLDGCPDCGDPTCPDDCTDNEEYDDV